MSNFPDNIDKSRILIVEDEAIIASEIEFILSHQKYEIVGHAQTGEDAVAMARTLSPDLILMDIVLLGEMSGIQAAADIKKQCDTSVIFLTAYSDNATIDKAKVAEPHAYILKPFQPKQLIAEIELALYKQKVARALKVAQLRLAESNRMAAVGELAAGVAHELNNPMAVMAGYLEEILEIMSSQRVAPKQDMERIRADLKKVYDQVFHCKNIIQNLVDFSRNQMSDTPIGQIDVNRALEFVIDKVSRRHCIGKPVRSIFGKDMPIIQGYEEQFMIALTNVIDNAVQAIEHKGEVKVETHYADREVRIRVSDSGNGISESNLGKVFYPFFTTKQPGKGLGLGMAITYSIIKRMGGEITIESVEGEGTVVNILLPAKS